MTGEDIPEIDLMVETCVKAHEKLFPTLPIAGWDLVSSGMHSDSLSGFRVSRACLAHQIRCVASVSLRGNRACAYWRLISCATSSRAPLTRKSISRSWRNTSAILRTSARTEISDTHCTHPMSNDRGPRRGMQLTGNQRPPGEMPAPQQRGATTTSTPPPCFSLACLRADV